MLKAIMFDTFGSSFHETGDRSGATWQHGRLMTVRGYSDLMQQFAGATFDGGLYRLHSDKTAPKAQDFVERAFPEFDGRAFLFGYDWLGRQFAVDFERIVEAEPQVLMLEPGTGEALEIPADLMTFHEREVVQYRDEALAASFFEQWLNDANVTPPLKPSDCVAYRVPLFLGGEDTTSNLELSDIEVYWELFGQLRRQVRGLSEGTELTGVTVRK